MAGGDATKDPLFVVEISELRLDATTSSAEQCPSAEAFSDTGANAWCSVSLPERFWWTGDRSVSRRWRNVHPLTKVEVSECEESLSDTHWIYRSSRFWFRDSAKEFDLTEASISELMGTTLELDVHLGKGPSSEEGSNDAAIATLRLPLFDLVQRGEIRGSFDLATTPECAEHDGTLSLSVETCISASERLVQFVLAGRALRIGSCEIIRLPEEWYAQYDLPTTVEEADDLAIRVAADNSLRYAAELDLGVGRCLSISSLRLRYTFTTENVAESEAKITEGEDGCEDEGKSHPRIISTFSLSAENPVSEWCFITKASAAALVNTLRDSPCRSLALLASAPAALAVEEGDEVKESKDDDALAYDNKWSGVAAIDLGGLLEQSGLVRPIENALNPTESAISAHALAAEEVNESQQNGAAESDETVSKSTLDGEPAVAERSSGAELNAHPYVISETAVVLSASSNPPLVSAAPTPLVSVLTPKDAISAALKRYDVPQKPFTRAARNELVGELDDLINTIHGVLQSDEGRAVVRMSSSGVLDQAVAVSIFDAHAEGGYLGVRERLRAIAIRLLKEKFKRNRHSSADGREEEIKTLASELYVYVMSQLSLALGNARNSPPVSLNDEFSALIRIATEAEMCKDHKRAAQMWQRSLVSAASQTETFRAWAGFGAFHARSRDFRAALECLRTAVSISNKVPVGEMAAATLLLGAILVNRGDPERALEALSDAIEAAKRSGELETEAFAHCLLATVLLDAEWHVPQLEEAKAHLNEAVNLAPSRSDFEGKWSENARDFAQPEALIYRRTARYALDHGLEQTAQIMLVAANRATRDHSVSSQDEDDNEFLAAELLRARLKFLAGSPGAAGSILDRALSIVDLQKCDDWIKSEIALVSADAIVESGDTSRAVEARKGFAKALAGLHRIEKKSKQASGKQVTFAPHVLSRGDHLFAEVVFKLGTQAALSKDYRTARAVFLNATRNERTERFSWSWAGLGAASINTGSLEQADAALQRASTLDEGSAIVWANMALLALKLSPPSKDEAEMNLKRSLQCGLKDEELLEVLHCELDDFYPELAECVSERLDTVRSVT